MAKIIVRTDAASPVFTQKYHFKEIDDKRDIYIENLQKTCFLDGLKNMDKCWTKCIEAKGDYIEK